MEAFDFDFEMLAPATGVPVGAYTGVFLGVEPGENKHGENFKWSWEITEGTLKGNVACRFTDRKPRPTTACGRMLMAVAGRQLGQGERFDPKSCVGKTYTVIVEATKSGATRVGTVARK
jgi:hypothetical protein